MTVYFTNEEPIDLATIELMGVSIKTGDSPIGYFGTGMKFAIATLLRTGHRISIVRDGVPVRFSVEREMVRGQEFERICMDGRKLGFTTALGKNWKPWMAFRELYANALDEGGNIDVRPPSKPMGTIIAVDGDGIEQAWRDRATIFLTSRPLHQLPSVDVHAGVTNFAFYKGMRAGTLHAPAAFTWNALDFMQLTEDRVLENVFYFARACAQAVMQAGDESFIEAVVMAKPGSWEASLGFDWHSVRLSDAFCRVVERHQAKAALNETAFRVWKAQQPVPAPEPAKLDEADNEELSRALSLLRRLDCVLEPSDITVVQDLGSNTLGLARDGRILIDRKVFDMGHRRLASTIYEEWLHVEHDYRDESRALQNLLLDRLFAFADKLVRLESRDGEDHS